MSKILTPRRVEGGFWLLVWAGLAVGIGLETDWGRQLDWPLPAVAAAPADFAQPQLTEAFRLPAPDQFLGVTERPIFVATRRPPPVLPPAEPPKPSMKKGQFVLMGTLIIPDGKFAILLEKSGNKSRTVAEGKEINGIMVKSVTPERVVLSQNDDSETLLLKTSVAPPPATTAPPAGTPGTPATPATPPPTETPAITPPAGTPGTRPSGGRRPPMLQGFGGASGQPGAQSPPGTAPAPAK